MSAGPVSRRERGFVLMLALFMIVSLAAIGAYLLTVSINQVEAGVQDEQGARAYQAARTGIEWGAYQVLRVPGGTYALATCNAAGSQRLTLAGVVLAGYFAEVGCKVSSETEGAVILKTYTITATGCNKNPCGGVLGPTYVERQLQLTLTK